MPAISLAAVLRTHRDILEIQPCGNRLELQVMVPQRDGQSLSCNSVIPVAIEVDKAVLYPEAHVAVDLVFEPCAQRPSVAPVVERKAVVDSRVAAGKINLCTSPSGLAIE